MKAPDLSPDTKRNSKLLTDCASFLICPIKPLEARGRETRTDGLKRPCYIRGKLRIRSPNPFTILTGLRPRYRSLQWYVQGHAMEGNDVSN